jgi:hypothetical protein
MVAPDRRRVLPVPEAEMILNQCAINQFHKLNGMNPDIAEIFDLNHAQMRFVQNATPGSDERGYSQALLGVDGEWRGVEIEALPKEKTVIDHELESERTLLDSVEAERHGISTD